MPQIKPTESACSAARALDLVGDRWAFLLVREVAFGTRHFDDFVAHLGIARNVLSSRLAKLVSAGVLSQQPLEKDGRRLVYRLSEMGEDLILVLLALMQWGDRWLQTPASVPIRIVERGSAQEVPQLRLRNVGGKTLVLRDLDWMPGPGANHPSIRALIKAYEGQRLVAARPVPKLSTPLRRSSSGREPRRPRPRS